MFVTHLETGETFEIHAFREHRISLMRPDGTLIGISKAEFESEKWDLASEAEINGAFPNV
jgi:hypothetical protein